MFCEKCGKELNDNEKFCCGCGAVVESAEASVPVEEATVAPAFEQTTWVPPVEEVKQPGKKLPPVLIIGAAVAAAVVLVVTLILTGVFDSDATRVYKAIQKSGQAFEKAAEALDLPDLQYIQKDKAYSIDFGMQLNEIEGADEISDLGLTGSVDYSLSRKKLGVTLKPTYGAVDIANLQMKLDNNMLYVSVPEITGDMGYSMNTETVFQDMSAFTDVPEEFEDVRINIFEIVQIMDEKMMYTKEDQKLIDEAVAELIKSIEAEKTDTKEITVNDSDLKCDEYHVVISEDALRNYIAVLADVMDDKDMAGAMRDAYDAMNIPTEDMDFSDLEDMDADDIMDELDDAIHELGDIELDVYVKGGYVMAVAYELDMDGEEVEVVLNIGGGENYVDNLSLTMSDDYMTIVLESTGNHAGKGGSFTDETILYAKEDGEKITVLESSLTFNYKEKGENFQWTIDMEDSAGVEFDICGGVTFSGSAVTCDLTDITVSEYGEELVDFSVYYKLDKYSDDVKIGNTVELLKLSEDELMEEIEELSEKAEDWAMDLTDQIPELLYLLY